MWRSSGLNPSERCKILQRNRKWTEPMSNNPQSLQWTFQTQMTLTPQQGHRKRERASKKQQSRLTESREGYKKMDV